MGYVYLIRNLENDTYKIGVTKNDPQKRVKQLQTGCSSPLDLLYIYGTKYPYRLEKMLHTKFMLHKVEGEWYQLPQENVTSFLSICDNLQNTLNILLDNPFFSKDLC
jgi:hypothetical protein